MNDNKIIIRGAKIHNLKNIDLDIPKNKLVVFTGLSGSGKSSLAFDTIYAEGQRRYMESLSGYARQFLEMQDKPDVDEISGLSPTIAINQKTSSHNPRSTVGTISEIYDYLRVLYARVAKPYHPETGKVILPLTFSDLEGKIIDAVKKSDVLLFAPMVEDKKGDFNGVLQAAKNAEFSQVRYDGVILDVDEAIALKKQKNKKHSIEILVEKIEQDKNISQEKIKTVLNRALDLGNGELILYKDRNGEDEKIVLGYELPNGFRIADIEPRFFSFNSPQGACSSCTGLGVKLVFEPEFVIPNKKLTIEQGAVKPWNRIAGNQKGYMEVLRTVAKKKKIDLNKPIEKLSAKQYKILLYGTGEEQYSFNGKIFIFPGIIGLLEAKYRETSSDYVRKELESYMRSMVCPSCSGVRLREEALLFKLADKSIADLVKMSLEEIVFFFKEAVKEIKNKKSRIYSELTTAEKKAVVKIAKEIIARAENLISVGLGYLSLNRGATTLSGGEAQRMRLATQLSSALSGIIYVLDEPSVGLHPRDNRQLISIMKKLRDMGNTILVVEHDEDMMREADYIFDIGPGAGEYGGQIVAKGTVKQLTKDKNSLTGDYLSGRKKIQIINNDKSVKKKNNNEKLSVIGATEHNLKNINVDIPLSKMVCVTGVSGSGKSTLILEILGKALARHFYRAKAFPGAYKKINGLQNIDKVVSVDQSPIGRTPRSNPATYTGVFTAIRDLFTEVKEAKMRGYDAGKFSFNVKGGGRCETCSGDGQIKIEMQFMPDVYAPCPDCNGRRYTSEVLDIYYRQKNIADVLDMTIDEARRFFADKSAIYEKLNVLYEVGLGYLKLGQPATTLSGGEAQRIKLATELSRRATGKTLYILDEPTSGLHFEDIQRLLGVLRALVDKGNTVLIIEHNPGVMLASDWIIDMGPEGGDKGGRVVAVGTPNDVAKAKTATGEILRAILKKK